jgi:hypothetical protein
MTGRAKVSVFLSSPADVQPEREAAERMVSRLGGVYDAHVELVLERWERRFYEASKGFQEAIAAMETFDLIVGILWKRIGSELPPDRYIRSDGTPFESGTVYEIETGLAASRRSGQPAVYVFRSTRPVSFSEERVEEERAQKQALDGWWARTFRDEVGHYVAATNSFSSTEDFEAKLEDCLVGWLEEKGHIPSGPVWDIATRGSPYPGLVAYDRDRSPVFFGRQLAAEQARDELLAAAAREGGLPALFVIGASGSGKSSLVRAGLVPQLIRPGAVPGVDLWRTAVTVPAADSLTSLAIHLYAPDGLPELTVGAQPSPERWARMAAGSPEAAADTVAWALDRATEAEGRRVQADRKLQARLLLVVDQLESLFGTPGQGAFTRVLRALLDSGRVWLLATLRSDRYAELQLDPELLALKRAGATYDLPPPGPAEMADVVKGPARAAGLTFAEQDGRSLARVLVEAAPNADALPLLQMALAQLFERREGMRLTFTSYQAMGNVEGAIATHANTVFAQLPADAQRELDPLVRVLVRDARRRGDGEVRFTAQAADRRAFETTAARRSLVTTLVDGRLLVSDDNNMRMAHEALLRRWSRARDSLERLADVELRKERRRRQWTAAAAVVFLGVAVGAVWQWLEARHQAEIAQQQLTEARASLIWNRLEFGRDQLQPHEVDALWDLTPEPAVHAAFLRQMADNRPLVLKFIKHLEPVLRAFGLRLGAEQAWAALGPVLEAMRDTTYNDPLEAPARAVQALAPMLGAEQAPAALGQAFEGLRGVTYTVALEALAQVVQALAPKLSAEQAQAALGQALEAIRSTTNPYAFEVLARAVQVLPVQLSAEQAQAALGPVFEAIKSTTDSGWLQALARAVQVLPVQLSAEQAQAALGPMLVEAMWGTTNPYELQALTQALQALAPRLDAEQAQAALGPVLEAMKGTTEPYALAVLAQAVGVLAPRLEAEAKAGILGITRSGLGAGRTRGEATAWFDALTTALPAEPAACIGAAVEVLKFPTAALQRPLKYELVDPALHLLSTASLSCPAANGMPASSLADFVAWVADAHPAVDLMSPPVRPPPLVEAVAAFQAARDG